MFREAFRVLRPGGALVFSDILLADDADDADDAMAAAFRQVNAVTFLRTAAEITAWMARQGFDSIRQQDWSAHLPENFRRMRCQIDRHRRELRAAGVAGELLDRFAASLDQRLSWPAGSVLRWQAFAASKPPL